MKLAFYLAKAGTTLDKLIGAYTRGPYSHVELVFDDCMRALVPADKIDAHDAGGSLCFSSSPRAPRRGCGFQNIDLADGKWKLVNVPVSPAGEMIALSLALKDCGREYDWAAIAGFIVSVIPDDRDARICSQECILLLQAAGLLAGVNAVRTSPNELFKLVVQES